MKKLLSIIGTISFITSGSSNLIACNNTPTLTSEELAELKEKNSKIINGNKLEWIAPQEKPFNNVDNKWYVVIWRINQNDDWRIIKFKHSNFQKKVLDKYNGYELKMALAVIGSLDLLADENRFAHHFWWEVDDGSHFKAVYRWDVKNEPPIIKINSGGEIEN